MSVQDIVAAVNQAVVKSEAAGTQLQQAGQAADEAAQALAQAAQGSSDQGLSQAVGALAEAVQVVGGISRMVAKVSGDLSAYAKSLAGDQRQDEARSRSAPSGGMKDAAPDDPVEKARRELPPPVTRGKGQKTHGRWFAPGKTLRPSPAAGTAVRTV